MIARYALLASRIRQDVAALVRVVERVERLATRLRPAFRDVSGELPAFGAFMDAVARDH